MKITINFLALTALLPLDIGVNSFRTGVISPRRRAFSTYLSSSTASTITSSENDISASPWFETPTATTESEEEIRANPSIDRLKIQILQLGAALDRGQSYNPTSGDYYNTTMIVARDKIQELLKIAEDKNVPTSLKDIEGEWELVFTTVKHGIFRSSPFFLAVQEAFEFAEEKEAFGEDKATLFFKLHELQTCSWGVSKIGRVAQRIDVEKGCLYSEIDTSIFSL